MSTKRKSSVSESIWAQAITGRYSAIWYATIALFLVSPFIAPGSVNAAPLLSMLPFAAILAIVAAGHTLVVQQRGLDLSVPGMVALAAVLVTKPAQSLDWGTTHMVILGILLPALFGLINGIVIVILGVMPLVVTLGMNSVLLGIVFMIANGTPSTAPNNLNQFALDRTWGVPNALLIAIVIVMISSFISSRTIVGHRLAAVGVNDKAARSIGIPIVKYQVLAYMAAGGIYGTAGILLAGYTKTPTLFPGETYLLPSVAAVVLGGTALTGGLASISSSAIGALFLTQLGQLFRALGWPDSWQLVAQASVLVIVVLLRVLVPTLRDRVGDRRRERRSLALTNPTGV